MDVVLTIQIHVVCKLNSLIFHLSILFILFSHSLTSLICLQPNPVFYNMLKCKMRTMLFSEIYIHIRERCPLFKNLIALHCILRERLLIPIRQYSLPKTSMTDLLSYHLQDISIFELSSQKPLKPPNCHVH